MRGYGDRPLARCTVRCRLCQGPGHLQLRAPQPGWDGPASHGCASLNRAGPPSDRTPMPNYSRTADSTMAMSCAVVPPLTPMPPMAWPSQLSGTPPPIAE